MNGHMDDRVHQYVAGTMSPAAIEAFEEHLLSCAECRETVRVGAAARRALADIPGATGKARGAGRRTLVWSTLGAAAALLIFVVRDASRGTALGAITPPVYRPEAVRAGGDSMTDLVDRGMRAYSASEFGDAAHLLGEAVAHDSSAGVAFYHGAALLLAGDAARAVPELLRARLPVGNPYSADAMLLAAKALVRLRLTDSAIAVLERSPPGERAAAAALRAFADSIRRR